MRVPAAVFFLALGSAALYGAADFVGGLASRRTSTMTVVLISQLAGLVVLASLVPLLAPATPSLADLGWGAAAGLFGGVGIALLYRGLAVGTMAVVAPTTAVCAVLVPVMVAIAHGERVAPQTAAGIVMALVAIVFVAQERRSSAASSGGGAARRLARGVDLAFASGIAIGLFYLVLARSGPAAGLWPLVSARAVSAALFGALSVAAARAVRPPRATLALIAAGGVLDMLANALYLMASRGGPLSVVVTLASLYPASTVVLARVVLRERLSGLQVAGVWGAIAAVALIVGG